MIQMKAITKMIRLTECKLPTEHSLRELEQYIEKKLGLSAGQYQYRITKRSIDARKKPHIFFVYTLDVSVANEKKWQNQRLPADIQLVEDNMYRLPVPGVNKLSQRPVIIGTGPAGLFCGYLLAEMGYRPILIERGQTVEERLRTVEHFWQTGELDSSSNVQFGEGGAGTFSDGKLNTLIKDHFGRGRLVLETFVRFGADNEILYDYKPHIGTDRLQQLIPNMRRRMQELGAEFHFSTCLTDLVIRSGMIEQIIVKGPTGEECMTVGPVVLALGHSARDTFRLLWQKELPMEAKPFAVGYRVEHPQSLINMSQYGVADHAVLGAAPYKVTYRREDEKRGVYSFCMCPGGFVVNASSEPGRLAVNGMSYHDRAGVNANSAIITSVSTADFEASDALAGLRFQEQLEERAYALAKGRIPVQYFMDFCIGKATEKIDPAYRPQIKGQWQPADVSSLLPAGLNTGIIAAMHHFAKQIPGFDHKHAIFSGIESRTSSPIRLLRNENLESAIAGLYPCGEGAGYAGGIMSAAIDGLKVAEAIIRKYSQPVVAD